MRLLREILGRVLVWIVQALLGVVFIALFAYLLVEWASGCGESYVDSKGKTHVNECLYTNLQRLR
jgi:hypothetical protein